MQIINGIPFECIMCGECCKWDGYVFLTDEDIENVSEHLDINSDVFIEKYTTEYSAKKVLKDKSNGECVFLKDNKCDIFSYKPKQCGEYPISYDKRCPGFKKDKEIPMKDKKDNSLDSLNSRLSVMSSYDKKIVENLFNELLSSYSSSKVATVAIENGIDDFFDRDRIKISSLDDLFSFNRVDASTLIHKSSRDLWKVDKDSKGEVCITRLFDNNGEPIRG